MEQADEELLRKILEAPVTTPKCMLYLETGCKPVRFLIMTRRLMFFHYILNEEEDSLIARFYNAQVKNPYKGDWCNIVQENLEDIEILLSVDQIKECSKTQFKTLVDKCVKNRTLTYLNSEKEGKTKVLHINFKMQKCQTLKPPWKIYISCKK